MTREEAINEIKSWDFLEGKEIEAIHTLIPELAESEDERIRKALVLHLKADVDFVSNGVTKAECLAYLEKQKEPENTSASTMIPSCWAEEPSLQKEQNPLTDFETAIYSYLSDDTSGKFDKEVMHKCAIERAKILLELARKEQKPFNVCEECPYYKDCPDYNMKKPAEWSEEDKEAFDMCIDAIPKAWKTKSGILLTKWLKDNIHLQSKQEWSDEDERMRNQLIYDVERDKKEGLISAKQNKATKALYNGIEECYDEKIAWLKSLPLNLKKTNENVAKLCSNEWSEEDERNIRNLESVLYYAKHLSDETRTELGNFLKSLRPSWKPSEHQMTILKAVKNYVGVGSGYWGEALGSLIEDLEKL